MSEQLFNKAAGWVEGITYPDHKIQLEDSVYQLGVTQKKYLYPHAKGKDGLLYSVLETQNKALLSLEIHHIFIREDDASQLLSFLENAGSGNNTLPLPNKFLLRAFGIGTAQEVFTLTPFKFPLGLTEQRATAFKIEKSNRKESYGLQVRTAGLGDLSYYYALLTHSDIETIKQTLNQNP